MNESKLKAGIAAALGDASVGENRVALLRALARLYEHQGVLVENQALPRCRRRLQSASRRQRLKPARADHAHLRRWPLLARATRRRRFAVLGHGADVDQVPQLESADLPGPERHQAPDDCPGLVRGVRCPDCEEIAVPSAIYPGISCEPWVIVERFRATGHVCQPPPPVCGKPPVTSRKWAHTTLTGADGRLYQGFSWLPVDLHSGAAVGEQIGLFT